jgi:hypothetical protein
VDIGTLQRYDTCKCTEGNGEWRVGVEETYLKNVGMTIKEVTLLINVWKVLLGERCVMGGLCFPAKENKTP